MDNKSSTGLQYAAFNEHVFRLIPRGISSLLDVGCGTGELGKAIRQSFPSVKLCGVTFSNEEAEQARLVYNEVFVHDINDLSIGLDSGWDCIIFSHVLEHTYHPEIILKHYSSLLDKNGTIIIALPNILFFKQRIKFLKGKFRYSETGGLMDNTHFRFFDFYSARQMVKSAGLEIISSKGQGAFPLGPIRSWLPGLAHKVDKITVGKWPGFFSFQFLIAAKKSN